MEEQKKKKCYIVGFAPSWQETPWDDEEAEIWCINEFYELAKTKPDTRADRWFEIHSLERPPKNSQKHIDWLKQCPIPLYTLKEYDFLENPNVTPFPFYDIVKWFEDRGHIGARYFTNSISWILAYAITEGFEEIHVYGVDMAVDRDKNGNDEYGYQKPSCEYFLGVAEKYAKVFIPNSSDLLYCDKMYAIEQDNERYVWIKKQIGTLTEKEKKLNIELQKVNNALIQVQTMLAEVRGAKEANRQILRKRV